MDICGVAIVGIWVVFSIIGYHDSGSGTTGYGSSTVQQHCVNYVRSKER